MPLLGWPLLVALAVGLVGAVVATLVLWNRVPGPVWAAIGQRLGLLVAVQVVATLLTAAALNNYGYFYGSWSDLLGKSGSARPVIHRVTRDGRTTGAGAHDAAYRRRLRYRALPWSTPAQYATRGELVSTTIVGPRSDLQDAAYVFLPPQYFQAPYRRTRFPGIEALTGYPGSIDGMVDRLDLPTAMDEAVAAHRARPMVAVFLDPAPLPPWDTECTNIPGGPQVETYLGEDVPSLVTARFRVEDLRWGILGYSTGGYCAAKILLAHSDRFSAGVGLSGYYDAISDHTTGDLWGGSRVVEDLNSPLWVVRHEPDPPVDFLATIGSLEPGSEGLVGTRRLISAIRPPMSGSIMVIRDGGHNFDDWVKVVPTVIPWLSHRIG